MTVEEAQNNFMDLLKANGITVPKESLFYDNKSKRLTSVGNIYASMLKISNEINQYNIQSPLSQEAKKILESNMKSFYFVQANSKINTDESTFNLTTYENDFDIKIQLLGGINEWWNKVKGEYHA